MAPNLFGQRFLGIREPAWHPIGTVLPEPIPALEAIKFIEADFEIVKAPLKIEISTLFGTQLMEDPGKFAIVRQPTSDSMDFAVLGHCGKDYEIVQRTDFAVALDKLTDRWPLETVGVLGVGETVFFTLDAGSIDIAGEEVHQYFLVYDKVDGKTSAKIAFTPVRVVCQNTLTTGLKQATMSAALDHRQGINKDFNFRVDLIKKMAEAQRLTVQNFDLLAKAQIREDEAETVFAAAYPYPSKPAKMDLVGAIDVTDELLGGLREQGVRASDSYDYYCKRADTMRDGARYLYGKLNDEFPNIAGTGWAAWNAVTEMADWRNGEDSVPVSALFGTRAVEKKLAFDAAMKLIK